MNDHVEFASPAHLVDAVPDYFPNLDLHLAEGLSVTAYSVHICGFSKTFDILKK